MPRTRKTPQAATPIVDPASKRARKKARTPRDRFTHIEIRRGETLRLGITIADDAIAMAGDELGALIKRIAPGTQTAIVESIPAPEGAQAPVEHDANHHAEMRANLVDLISSLCDSALSAALEIARAESARRAEGGN